MITGLDLVEWQLRVAAGEKLPLRQEDLAIRGHAIEARLYAEDTDRGFLPQTGQLTHLAFAGGENIRVDTGVKRGDAISVYYDPMIAKLIVWGADRDAAIGRFQSALAETQVGGLKTNIAFLARLAGHSAFRAADLDTSFIARHEADLLAPPQPASDKAFALAALGLLLSRAEAARQAALASADPWSPWAHSNGWRLNDEARSELRLRDLTAEHPDGRPVEVIYRRQGGWKITPGNGSTFDAQGKLAADGKLSGIVGDEKVSAVWVQNGMEINLFTKDGTRRFAIVDRLHDAEDAQVSGGRLVAPMPGRVISLLVEPGAHVEANEPVIVLEAMKMEHTLRAPSRGTVAAFRYAAGEQVDEGAELLDFQPEEAEN
jgi:3-methylcrotonyl-CoA carboxylase alpha subunit